MLRFEINVGCYVPNDILTVLQETLKSTMEGSVIPAFEMSCKAMFEQVDLTFQKGFSEHTASALQQFESIHSPLVHALRVWLLSSGFSMIYPSVFLQILGRTVLSFFNISNLHYIIL